MAKPVVRVRGVNRLARTLRAAGSDLDELRAAHTAAAAYVASASAAAAPNVTGALAGSVRGSHATRRATVRAGYARVPYAGPIHWGWPRRNIAPQPFIADTARATEPTWVRMYEEDLRRILRTVKGA